MCLMNKKFYCPKCGDFRFGSTMLPDGKLVRHCHGCYNFDWHQDHDWKYFRLTAPTDEGECKHEWVDESNKYTLVVKTCLKCEYMQAKLTRLSSPADEGQKKPETIENLLDCNEHLQATLTKTKKKLSDAQLTIENYRKPCKN